MYIRSFFRSLSISEYIYPLYHCAICSRKPLVVGRTYTTRVMLRAMRNRAEEEENTDIPPTTHTANIQKRFDGCSPEYTCSEYGVQ